MQGELFEQNWIYKCFREKNNYLNLRPKVCQIKNRLAPPFCLEDGAYCPGR